MKNIKLFIRNILVVVASLVVCITSNMKVSAQALAAYDICNINPAVVLNNEIRQDVDITLGLQSYYINEVNDSNKVIFFFHGGAFMSQPMDEHFFFADDTATRTGAEVIIPIYPLIPWHNYADVYNKLLYQYAFYVINNPEKEIIFMGDSAGGTIAIGMVQRIVALGMPKPSKLILISPWVDISMTSPYVTQYANTYMDSGITVLQTAAIFWARGTKGVYDPLVNPMYGNIEGFPSTLIITGTQDMFHGDITLFESKLEKAGAEVQVIVGEDMVHDYPILYWPYCGSTVGESIAKFVKA